VQKDGDFFDAHVANVYCVRVDTIPISHEQRKYIAARVCRTQRELATLVEHLYQIDVPFDDELQALTVRALDDMQRLQLFVRSIDVGAFPVDDDAG
jgi:hypothetical protein